jgi:hypothetical protein
MRLVAAANQVFGADGETLPVTTSATLLDDFNSPLLANTM